MKSVRFIRYAFRTYFSFSGITSEGITEGDAKSANRANLTDRSGTVLVTSSPVPLRRLKFLGIFLQKNVVYSHKEGARIAEFGPALHGELVINGASLGKLKPRSAGRYFHSLESEHFTCGFLSDTGSHTLEFQHTEAFTELEAICAAVHLGLGFDS